MVYDNRDIDIKRLLAYLMERQKEQGGRTATITYRQVASDIAWSYRYTRELLQYAERIGVVALRSKKGSHNGTTVVFCDTKIRELMADGSSRTPTEIDNAVMDVLRRITKNGKQCICLAGDFSGVNIGPVELGKSLDRLSTAGEITARPIIIDEKWIVTILPGIPEPTPKDKPLEKGKCPKCGTVLPDGAKFCYMCGERMPKTEMEQLHDRFNEVLSRVARMYANADRAQKDLEVLQKVAKIAFDKEDER